MLNKIKIDLKDGVVVTVPYKNGKIRWRMFADRTSYYWRFDKEACPPNYQPTRVEKAHKQFLKGRKLQNRLIRSAAAQHKWKTMESFRITFDNSNCAKRCEWGKDEQVVK